MSINEFHASHTGRVGVDFCITSPSLEPDRVTEALNLAPKMCAKRGDERRNYAGQILSPHENGFWVVSSKSHVEGRLRSKDVNEHIRYLLGLLLPHRESILRFAEGGEITFGVLWESRYLYAGTGPIISRGCIEGISRLGADIGFDIYQIEGSGGKG